MDNVEMPDDEDDNLVKKLSEDILDQVFQFLPIRSLCKNAQVCKLWYEVAQREMSKRGLHAVVLKPNSYEIKHVIHKFKVKPKISLYFCASRPHLRAADNVDYAKLSQYSAKFPFMGNIMLMGVEHSMLNTCEIKSCQEFDYPVGTYFPENGVLGIIIPDTKDFNVKFAWCVCDEARSEDDACRIFEQLQPNEHEGNPVYLMFGMNGFSVGRRVLSMLRQKYKNTQPNLWGGTMAKFIKTNDSYPTAEEVENYKRKPHPKYISVYGFLGILLQRSRLSVYSTIISLTDNLSKRLTEFKTKVTLRRRSLGMVCGSHSKGKVLVYQEIMEAVKHQFPTITFAAYFNSLQLHYYGCDNTSTDGSKELIHEEAISIMILTYD